MKPDLKLLETLKKSLTTPYGMVRMPQSKWDVVVKQVQQLVAEGLTHNQASDSVARTVIALQYQGL